MAYRELLESEVKKRQDAIDRARMRKVLTKDSGERAKLDALISQHTQDQGSLGVELNSLGNPYDTDALRARLEERFKQLCEQLSQLNAKIVELVAGKAPQSDIEAAQAEAAECQKSVEALKIELST